MPQQKSVRLTLAEIREVLRCTVLAGEDRLSLTIDTVVASDGMSAVLAGGSRGSLLITGLANIQSVRTAHVADVAAIIYIRGVRPLEQTIELARQKGIVLLSTSLGMFHCCGILYSRGLKGVI
jgi:predicted transcriptional regulator